MLLDRDPDKEFGLTGLQTGQTVDDILDLVEQAAGAPIDREARTGPVEIRPEPILTAARAAAERLRRACDEGARVVFATGHPVGLAYLYHELAAWMAASGADLRTPAEAASWPEHGLDHDWEVVYWDGVAMLSDTREPRHTHWPYAMHRILEAERPDLVFADHGFAGAAIEAGVETISIADVNDPALLVARAQGRTRARPRLRRPRRPERLLAGLPCAHGTRGGPLTCADGFGARRRHTAAPTIAPHMSTRFTHARLLTVNEVADLLRVSRMTVYRLIKDGQMKAIRVGRNYRLREDDVDEYLSKRYTEAI